MAYTDLANSVGCTKEFGVIMDDYKVNNYIKNYNAKTLKIRKSYINSNELVLKWAN